MSTPPLPAHIVQEAAARALAEDVGTGDLTSLLLIAATDLGQAEIIAKAAGVLCGLAVAKEVFRQVDPAIAFTPAQSDGARLQPGAVVAAVSGPTRGILTAERVALNFLQQLSGVATATAALVDACAGTGAQILDTRKTVPGLRALQRYAVRVGGGVNHRFALDSGILIKENHIRAAGGIGPALARARAAGPMVRVEIEVENLAQLAEALAAGADLIMLDNMDAATMAEAATMARGRARLEASGSVTLATAAAVARTGVDYISVGSITHSAPALDLSLLLR